MKVEIIPFNSKKKLYVLPNGINRAVTSFHVNELVQSIELMGITRAAILIELSFLEDEKKTYILDGQHLREATNKLSMDLPVVYVNPKNVTTIKHVIEIVARLNNSSKSWNLGDYVNSWSKCPETRSAYKTLMVYQDKTNLGYSTLAMVCQPYTISMHTHSIKDGSFKITNKSVSEAIIENITDIFQEFKRGYASEIRVLVQGYIMFYVEKTKKGNNTLNHSKFMNNLKQHRSRINQYMHKPVVLALFFEEVYNGGKISSPNSIIAQAAGSPKSPIGG